MHISWPKYDIHKYVVDMHINTVKALYANIVNILFILEIQID